MRRNNKQVTTYFILFSLLLIGVVYAILQANLQINGTAKIKANTWDIHFNNIVVNENSVSIGTGDSPATIDPNNNCKVDFEVTLSLPGDFYEFTVDVVNAGTIDGMIGELSKTLKVNNEVVSEMPDYLEYSVTYADGMEILENHKLAVGFTETYKVRLEFKIDIEELPESTTITTSLEPQYLQADSSSVVRPNVFVSGTWDQIVDAYNSGAISSLQATMEAGTTREVQLDMDNNGIPETTAHLRIANLSTPSECSSSGFSQTACGFVIEFADIINDYEIHSSFTTEGGWSTSKMRTYLNDTSSSISIINSFPDVLKNKIIDTNVVSSTESVFTTIDKLYLLHFFEIYGSAADSDNLTLNELRQLDYYNSVPVTKTKWAGAIKKKNDVNSVWWTRTYSDSSRFMIVGSTGYRGFAYTNQKYGVSPAFRLAE
ncbi:MAG: hypothetical protein IJG68_04645 [Bacilli bacterium]|nr:hypothetical protein [Bacilli bacterium]